MAKTTIGYGAFFSPPSQLCKANPEKLPPTNAGKRPIVIDTTTSEGLRVIVTDDCFVCPIGVSQKKAFEFLNVLFAVFITKFQRARFITKNDLCPFRWNQNLNEIFLASDVNSLRSLQENKRDVDDDYEYWSTFERQPILIHLMEMLIDQSSRFIGNESFKNDLLIIGESGGMYQDDLFSVSFLNSWIVIESVIERIWEEYVKELNRTKEERQALNNHHSWSTSHYIEVFTFSGKLDSKGYECLTKLRKLRNDIVHRKKREVSKENAWNCMNIAIILIYNQLNQLKNPFKEVEYQIKKFDS